MTHRNTRVAVATISAAALLLAGCSNSESDSGAKDAATSAASSATSATAASATEASSTAAHSHDGDEAVNHSDEVHLHDAYVKAAAAGTAMTAVFGTLHNHTDKPITVESFTTSLGENLKYEIHEVVDGQMRKKDGGLEIPANGSLELKPGGDHLMIMDMTEPVPAGATVDVTLKLSNGETAEITGIPVRDIAAGGESYGDDKEAHMDHNMSEMNHEDHADHK